MYTSPQLMEETAFTKIRAFVKRHALMAGGLAVSIPLLVIILLQYKTLTTLNQTLPAYRLQLMRQYLMSVVEDFNRYYREHSERTLSVPTGKIDFQKSAVIEDNKDHTLSQQAVARVAEHFKQQDFRGAKRYFIAVATRTDGVDGGEVFFFDPEQQAMVRDSHAPEIVAINVASASYMIYIRKGSVLMPAAASVDRSQSYPLIVKPIIDESKKIVAVAGMVLDQKFFYNTILPDAIRKSLPQYLPSEDRDAIVTLHVWWTFHTAYDGKGNRLELPESEKMIEPEAYQPLFFVFDKSSLGIRLKHLTAEQRARNYFMINLSLWIVMTLFLIGAIALMLRTASREMRLTQMKADFVSNVSHELRTPLASIRVLAELLNLGRVKEADRVREYGSYIESEGRRLTQVINNILDFSRIESGRKLYHFEPCDVSEVVCETLEAFAIHLKHNGFALDYQAPQDALPKAILDPDAIALALTNLLDNAIKYSGPVKEINISIGQTDGFVTVAVSDRGVGIAAEEQEKIFDKFYRVSTGLVHDVKGSGLGLSLVKHIVEAHSGKLTVQSKPGEGSTFTIHLPVADRRGDQAGRESSESRLGNVEGDARTFGLETKA